jgi:chromosome segregation protein
MRLQRLIVQGFKSFKDRTVIEFNDGITGIVGPNGCGKSNIVDAIYWIMGEQSAKHLRGTSMKDLIFSGSSKYAPASYAEVTLVLDNINGKHIHINGTVVKPQEIQLTRKLYRNGETEYKINGEQARLKDIHEVFMDTGAGAKSYSIIAQGEINKLVQAKPEERRVMIEEVAGITKFKLRKRESLKKIEATQQNLSRLEDLQNEIYKNLKNLEKQAEKADRARTLKEKIKKYELIVDSHKELDFIQDYVNAHEILGRRADEKEKISLEKNQIELLLEDERSQKTDMMDQLDDQQASFNQESKLLAASEEKIKHLRKSLADKFHQIDHKQKENKELEVEKEHRGTRLEKLESELAELQAIDVESIDLNELEEKVSLLKIQYTDLEEELAQEKTKSENSMSEMMSLDHEIFKNGAKLEEYARVLQDLTLEIEALEKTSTQWSDEILKEREKVARQKGEHESLEIEVQTLKSSFEEKKSLLIEKQKIIQAQMKNLMQLEAKRDSYLSIKDEAESKFKGVQSLLESHASNQVQLLSGLITSQTEYAQAIEVLLADLLPHLVTLESRQDMLSWFHQIQGGFQVLTPMPFIMSAESKARLELFGLGEMKSVTEVITINEPSLEPIVRTLLEGYFICSALLPEQMMAINPEVSFKGLISTDSRYLVKKTQDGLIYGQKISTDAPGMGIIERNNQIAQLSVTIDKSREELQVAQDEANKLEDEFKQIETDFNEKSARFQVLAVEYAKAQAALDSREKHHTTSSDKLNLLLSRRQETSRNRLELLEIEERLEKNKLSLEQRSKDFQSVRQNLMDRLSDAKIAYENERDEFMSLKMKMDTYASQMKGLNSQIEDVKEQLHRIDQKVASNQLFLEQGDEAITQMEDEISSVEGYNREQAEVLSSKEEQLSILKDQLSELLLSMQEKESRVKEITSRIAKIDKENVEVEFKRNQIVAEEEILSRNNFEKYQVNLRQVIMNHLELSTEKIVGLKDLSAMFVMQTEEGETTIESQEYIFSKMFPGEIKDRKEKLKEYKSEMNRLGEINWQAIEDYDHQKMRHDFLKAQEEELKKSLNDLTVAIHHIDEKSKARFKEAFTEVNERFSKVFPIIFGGGSARLDLVGHLDDPECGVDIIAQPPGKKMQSIQLMSGGEKAMTAVSLIFSIFLVKPSPFCLLDEVDAPLDDANVGRFNELLREMSTETQFILITHNKKTMELNDTLFGVTMQEPGVSKAVSVQLH